MKKTVLIIALVFSVFLAACGEKEEKMVAVDYFGYNHTDKSIVSIKVNGEGGILDASAHGGGGQICCVMIPLKWRPGLTVTIKWQEDSIPVRDAKGKRIYDDGVPVLIESPWKERTVDVPKYEEAENFHIHFLPNDEVKVAVSLYGPRNPKHPYRFADTPLISP
jgi:hypothetical protein